MSHIIAADVACNTGNRIIRPCKQCKMFWRLYHHGKLTLSGREDDWSIISETKRRWSLFKAYGECHEMKVGVETSVIY